MMHWLRARSKRNFFFSFLRGFVLTWLVFLISIFHSRRRRKLLAKLFPNLFMIVFHNTKEDINHVRSVTYVNADILLIEKNEVTILITQSICVFWLISSDNKTKWQLSNKTCQLWAPRSPHFRFSYPLMPVIIIKLQILVLSVCPDENFFVLYFCYLLYPP